MRWDVINTIGLLAVGLLTFVNNRVINTLRVEVDGRLSQLLASTKQRGDALGVSEHAKGVLAGHAEEKAEQKEKMS